MKACKYPDFESHCKLHKRLSASVKSLVQKWHDNSSSEAADLLHDFLRKWLSRHILKEDFKYTSYMNDEQKISDVLAEITIPRSRQNPKITG